MKNKKTLAKKDGKIMEHIVIWHSIFGIIFLLHTFELKN